MQKALTTSEWLRQDEQLRQLQDDRKWALRVFLSIMEEAREEGREKGRTKAMQRTVREIAHRMLSEGYTTDTVARVTGLSVEEIEQLLHDTTHTNPQQ